VARARRRWIREQGFLDQAHLVYRRDGSHHHLLTAGSFACAREGADVLIAYLNEDQDAKETQRLVEEVGRKTVLVAGDISAPEHCRAIIDRCVKELGGIGHPGQQRRASGELPVHRGHQRP
jgi:hypothetical protein